jgi:gluconokinase
MVVILMGVSGAGKTTIGKLLAEDLGWGFYDGDDFHPQANIDKMRQGIALTDDDRKPWLMELDKLINKILHLDKQAVITCSALKKSHREFLLRDKEGVFAVYLKGGHDTIRRRLEGRQGHFFGVDLVASQFDALEEPEPEDVLTVDITQNPKAIRSMIKRKLKL